MFVSVYVTASTSAEAEKVARHVLEARLAACANAFPLRSWYWWEGRLEQAEEVAVLFKTQRDLVPALEAAVKAVHSYSVPCVVAWPIEAGSAAYLQWLAAEADPAKAERKA